MGRQGLLLWLQPCGIGPPRTTIIFNLIISNIQKLVQKRRTLRNNFFFSLPLHCRWFLPRLNRLHLKNPRVFHLKRKREFFVSFLLGMKALCSSFHPCPPTPKKKFSSLPQKNTSLFSNNPSLVPFSSGGSLYTVALMVEGKGSSTKIS